MARGKVILIGGASLAGKSTLAARLGEELCLEVLATDYLARHPGRPWRDDGSAVPEHVVDHFQTLEPEALLEDVLRHYRSLHTQIQDRIDSAQAGLIVEGSAVLPELAARNSELASIFLIAPPGFLSERILAHGGAENVPARKFAARAELMNATIAAQAEALALPCFDAAVDPFEEVLESLKTA